MIFPLEDVNDFPLEDVPISPTGLFKQSLDSFNVTDSPLSVTNIAQMAMFPNIAQMAVSNSPLSVTNISMF